MKKIIKLACTIDNEFVYLNPQRVLQVASLAGRAQVSGRDFTIDVNGSWNEIRRLFKGREFIELVALSNKANVLANTANISEWHEQDGGVFLEFDGKGFVVEGTLEEVTAKIAQALEEVEPKRRMVNADKLRGFIEKHFSSYSYLDFAKKLGITYPHLYYILKEWVTIDKKTEQKLTSLLSEYGEDFEDYAFLVSEEMDRMEAGAR